MAKHKQVEVESNDDELELDLENEDVEDVEFEEVGEESKEEELDESEAEDEESEEPDEEEELSDGDDSDGGVVITIDGEAPTPEQDKAPDWVRELRKDHKETQAENRRLQAELAELKKPTTVTLGPKPTLEGCDYDSEEFEKQLTTWYDQKRKAAEEEAQLEADAKQQQEAWNQRLDAYNEQKTKLGVDDFEDAEAAITTTFNQTQQGIIVSGAKDAALVMYALGKNPTKAKELAAINDPVKFAFAVSKLEEKISMSKKTRKAPQPEKRVATGTGSKANGVDSQLERLRTEAEQTGNYTKVNAYKRKLKQKRAAKS